MMIDGAVSFKGANTATNIRIYIEEEELNGLNHEEIDTLAKKLIIEAAVEQLEIVASYKSSELVKK